MYYGGHGRMDEMPKQQKNHTKGTAAVSRKSAMDELLDSFEEIVDSGAEKMTPSELRESEKRFNEIADRVVARKRRRETA
jgi:hypothetical protein